MWKLLLPLVFLAMTGAALAHSGHADPGCEPAVVDRIVDRRFAVVLIGEREVEAVLPRTELPAAASSGVWLRACAGPVPGEQGEISWQFEVDLEATQQARARIVARLERLRVRSVGCREPIQPIETIEPLEPIESIGPIESTETAKSAEAAKFAETAESVASAELIESIDSVDSIGAVVSIRSR